MSRLATWIVVVLLVSAACGDSGDTTTSAPPPTTAPPVTEPPPTTTTEPPTTTTTLAPTTTLPPTTTTGPPAPEDILAEMERRVLAAGIVGGGVPLSRDEAGCLAQVIADTLGLATIDQEAAEALLSGGAADPLQGATRAQADAILAGGGDCVDIVTALEAEAPEGVDPEEYVLQAIAAGLLEGAAEDPLFDVTEDQARCVGRGMFDTFGLDGIEALALADMLGLGDTGSPIPGATEAQLAGLVQTMIDCVDFTAFLSLTFQEEGLSPESADCAAEALLETTFFEDVVVQLALGEEAIPEDPEMVGEVVQVLLSCLTPEEIGEMVGEG